MTHFRLKPEVMTNTFEIISGYSRLTDIKKGQNGV